jgi:hypothetical protein
MDDSIDHVPRFALQFILHRRSPGLAPVPRVGNKKTASFAAFAPVVARLDGAIRIDRGSIHQSNRAITLCERSDGLLRSGE